MLKNKFLLAFFALVFSTALKAQTITIDDARLALPAGQTYGSGSVVAIPVTLSNGCFAQTNVFTWVLKNAAGTSNIDSGKVTAFYITFMNATLPIGLASGQYKFLVKASTVGSVSDSSALIDVTNVASPVIARAVPAISDYILRNEYYYGICDGNSITSMTLNDSSTVGGTDSLILYDNYRGGSAGYVPSAQGKFNLLFNPTLIGSKFRDAYYTAFVKTVSATNIVSTKAYHIINNTWDINTAILAKAPGTTYSCAGDTVSLKIVIDKTQDQHILQNFPAALVDINFNDGSGSLITLSQCQILAANGIVKHQYKNGACSSGNSTSIPIVSTVTNPFSVFNGPGITGTCAAGAKSTVDAFIFSPPKARFNTDTVVCANDTIKFLNNSLMGQGPANGSNITFCAQLANFTWVIDGNTASPLYQTPFGKVEQKKDTAYSFNSNQPGYHTATLYINNNYGFQAPCPSHDTTKTFCVDTAKVRPDFQLDSAGSGVLKDSIVGCAPVFCIKNVTKRTFCVDTTQFNYYWRVLDATSPGPNYLEVPQNVNYSFTSGSKRSKSPCISINKTGKYFIELMASASCDLDSTTRMLKYVEANGDAGVNFPTGSDTLKSCTYTTNTSTLTIDYSPTAPFNNAVGLVDSVHYTYQASTAGALIFGWAVTKNGGPAVYGTDYTFAGTILDSALQYPKITFKKPGLFKVRVTFSNNCQPKTAVQYVAFSEPIQVSSGLASNVTDSICHTTNTFNITGASASTTVTNSPVGQIYWTTNGDGTFNPQSGTPTTPNIFSPVYTPGPNDKAISCSLGATITLTISVLPVQPSNCAVVSGTRKLFIRPCVTVSDTAFNSCSGSAVNYAITKPGLVGSSFTWTYAILAGSVTGTTNNAIGGTMIPDILTGNGIVQYTLLPKKDGCVGNPFTVTDTVRPIPSTPTINLLYPNNATQSMCSADTARLQITSAVSSDLFSWTSYTKQGYITGNSNGVKQPGSINDILVNVSSLFITDTAIYVVRATSKYGCNGSADSNFVIVTPGPNVAVIYGGNPRYTCNKSCDTIRHSKPGVAGVGTFSIVSSSVAAPTFTNLNDSVTVVCGMQANGDYVFRWTIDPFLAGCVSTSADVNVQIFDTLPTPFAGLDTTVCDVTGTVQRTAKFKGTISRPTFSYEYVQWNGGNIYNSNYTFNYTNPGVYPMVFRTSNQGVCPDKTDTVLLRAYAKPSGGSLSFAPIQSSYCQGSTVTIKANYDKTKGDLGSWQTSVVPFVGYTIIPATSDSLIYTLFRQTDFSAYIYSKGWNFGCKDSAQTSGQGFLVDSPSVAGVAHATDTVVCVPGTTVFLTLTGSRPNLANPRWIVSTNSQNGPYTPSGIGSFYSATINQTSWYRAIVQNGNCNPDTSAPVRIFLPTGADVAKTGNDTAVCDAKTIVLQGNVPVVGTGYWEMINGQITGGTGGGFVFDASNNYTTTTNPVLVNISTYGNYTFVWKVKNLNCDATSDSIKIKNTAPISVQPIATAQDTVCSGTVVVVTGNPPTGGGGTFSYSWQYSSDNGTTWTVGSLAANSYTFTTSTDVWVRRVIKSDSCYDYSNIIKFIVQPKIANNAITPASNATCINTPVPNFTGSLPTGGSGTYNYAWSYGNSTDTANHIWTNPGVTTQNYNPGFNLTDTLHFRRIVTSGKCSDTSAVATVVVYPDAKASFTSNKVIGCAPFAINIDVPNPPAPNTNFNWFATTGSGVRTPIGTGAGFPGYTISTGLDSIKVTVIATSTFNCKPDSMSKWFYTSATPFASFTVSADSGCANNTGLNTTTFNFTNTTPNQGLFTYIFNYGNSTSTSNPNPNPIDYAPSTTGLDTSYTVVLTATSPACGSSQANHIIKIRTRPHVSFGLSPTYQCSGGPVTFTNQTVGSPNLTWNWKFGDGTGTSNLPNPTYVYNVFSLTTFNPVLIAANECASDSATNSAVIAANTVTLNISVKGSDKYKCLPDTVTFYTNSIGGTSYFLDFGDGSLSVPNAKGKDTITHVYTKSGKFVVTLTGSTTCGSVVKTDSVFAYGTPIVAYSIAPNTTVCKGDTVRFTNLTDTANNYVWDFGNGTGGGVNPTRTYAASGIYPVKLTATRFHNLPINGVLPCTDTSSIQTITIRDTMPASFTITPLGASCLPYAVQFNNTTNISTLPITTTKWTFGEPVAQSGNPVSHTYNQLGQYNVNLTVVNAGNCTYIDSQKVTVAGPIGTWTHDTGYVCGNTPVNFQINASSTDSCTINYGDATPVITVPFSTFPNPFTHVYTSGGNYTPTVTLKSVNGCSYFIGALGTIRVDYVKAGYTINTPIQNCGNTVQGFTNKTTMDQSPALAAYVWNINGVTYNVPNPSVTFNATGVYNVKMQVTSVSGCFDSVTTAPLYVKVNNIPANLGIARQDTACVGQTINYVASLSINPGDDPIMNYNWGFGNNTAGSGVNSQTIYNTTGVYFDTLTVVTTNGCTNTKLSNPLVINGSPIVSINPSIDTTICSGASINLSAFSSGATPIATYSWYPPIGLSATTGANVVATPTNLTKYIVTGTSAKGCTDTASINIDVVQPYTVSVISSNTPHDSICIGEKITLYASGASSYLWSPAAGLDTIRGSKVVASPTATTVYTVVGTNAANCFTPSASISVGVGDTTRISLGLDTVYLQGGTTLPLTPSVVNGPIATWAWTPATNLSCADCGNPTATVKSNVCYSVEATSIYGCKAYDSICIIAFCEASQVFIPNGFTPDGDGVNDYLWIKARGIKSVKSFRIFNRWGQVVFERANFTPVDYDKINAWDGKIKGVIAPTEVYVYTCEVICENGTKFTYTGNVAVIK